MGCEDAVDLIFEGFCRHCSGLNIDEDVACNSLEVDVPYPDGLLERVVDCRVALCACGACKHECNPLFHRKGGAGGAAQ